MSPDNAEGLRGILQSHETERTNWPVTVSSRYSLLAQLGSGGMGVVYRAYDTKLSRDVALKVLREDLSVSQAARTRFQREAEALARLSHPNIVAIHDVATPSSSQPYLVMDLVEGRSLAQCLQDGPLPCREAANLVVQLADALTHAHRALVLHRDLKPSNVLLTMGGTPLLTDFGLAKLTDDSAASHTDHFVGTPHYVSPEQAQGTHVDVRTDVYGLGATLYALLTGQPPFQGETTMAVLKAVLSSDPPRLSRLRPEVEADLETICHKALQPAPDMRYATVSELGQDLQAYLDDRPIRARRPTLRDSVRKWVRRNPTLARASAAGLGVLLVASSVMVLWTLHTRAESAVREAAAREAGLRQAQSDLVQESRKHAQVALASLHSTRGRTLGQALEALQRAERWVAQAPDDRDAVRSKFDAAVTLGDLASASQQWDLAAEAFSQAALLGVNDRQAERHLADLTRLRNAAAVRRLNATKAVLRRVETGRARKKPNGLTDATFEVVHHLDEGTVAFLSSRVLTVARELRQVETSVYMSVCEPNETERKAGKVRIARLAEALEQHRGLIPQHEEESCAALEEARYRLWARHRTQQATHSQAANPRAYVAFLVAGRQSASLGQHRQDLVRVAAGALGRVGFNQAFNAETVRGAVTALVAHLRAERNGLRAVHTGLALNTIGGQRAEEALGAALEDRHYAHPNAFKKRLQRAMQLEEQGSHDSAPQGLKRVTLPYGRALIARGRLRAAISVFDRILQTKVKPRQRAEGLYLRGLAYESLGAHSKALDSYTASLQMAPTDEPHRWGAVARMHVNLGNCAEAEAALERVKTFSAEEYFVRALLRRQQKRYREALADCTLGLQTKPNGLRLVTMRASLRNALGDFKGAKADATRALKLDPERDYAWCALGIAQRNLGQLEASVASLSRALDLGPKQAALYYFRFIFERALTFAEMKNSPAAFQDVSRALELQPDFWGYLHRSGLLMKQKKVKAALGDLTSALKLRPSNAFARRTRARIRLEARDFQGAISDLTLVLEHKPQDSEALALRGYAHLRSDETQAARRDLEQALRLDETLAPRLKAWLKQLEGK